MKPALLLALTFFAVTSVAYSQEEPAAFQIRVVVELPDEDLAERVSLYARNELRSIDDVELTEDDPDYTLFFRVIEMKAGEHTIGHVLGIAVVSYFPEGYFKSVIDPRLNNADEVAEKLDAVNVFEHQLLSVAGSKEADLIQGVAEIVPFTETIFANQVSNP